MSYDPTSDQGKVRLMIADTSSLVFQDNEVQAALDQEDGNVARAAAVLLDAMAALYARRSPTVTVLDIKADFSQISKDLRAQAKAIRDAEAEGTAFDIGEMVEPGFARDERRVKQWEREHA